MEHSLFGMNTTTLLTESEQSLHRHETETGQAPYMCHQNILVEATEKTEHATEHNPVSCYVFLKA